MGITMNLQTRYKTSVKTQDSKNKINTTKADINTIT